MSERSERELLDQELRRVRAELDAMRVRQSDLYDLAHVGYCTVNDDGLIVDVNAAAAALLGVPADVLVQQPFSCFVLKDDQELYRQHCRLVVETCRPQTCEVRMLKDEGTVVWARLDATRAQTREGAFVNQIALSDITERKQTEVALRQAKEVAENANRAKSQFLATMSHELRTPLNPILGFVELLSESTNLTAEQREWLRIITQRGQDLLGLIGAVLDLGRIESDKIIINLEPLELRQTIHDIVESVLPAARKKGLQLTWVVEPELSDEISADGFRLRQVLLNLLTNAVKFTEHGEIALQVSDGRAAGRGRAPLDGEVKLLFSVRDTGMGIAEERHAAVFEAFTCADEKDAAKYGGAGLGLTIAWHLVELMGGQIWVDSSLGGGSTFWFTVIVGASPAVRAAAAVKSAGQSAGGAAAPETRPLRVLAVDDDSTSLKMVEVLLRQAGQEVAFATNGKEAVALMQAREFDVVLMDAQMPIMDGLEATRRIREHEATVGRHTRIIALTAYAMAGDRERMLQAGMDDYLAKPVLAAHLREAIRGVRG